MQSENIVLLNINLLVPNSNQPRKNFNEESIKELAISIKEYGILNPILVRKKENLYEIIAGERRYRAAKSIGLSEVPVIVKDVDENKLSEIALIENLQRENLTPIEEAKTYENILKNTNTTEQQLSELIGKSQPFISNKLRLLKLPEEIQIAINNKKISEKHARSLLTIDNKTKQIELLNKIVNEKLSVKELDNLKNNQKEEKESDNMNNGNFFPNNNILDQNNNMSLNQMNMQTMGVPAGAPTMESVPTMTEPVVETPMVNQPTILEPVVNSPLPQVEIQNIEPNPQTVNPGMPDLTNNMDSPIPDFGVNNNIGIDNIPVPSEAMPQANENPLSPAIEPTNESATSAIENVPLFGEMIENKPQPDALSPVMESIPTPVLNEPITPPIQEAPLFNQDLNTSTEQPNLNESFYEVPVNVSPVIETPQEDRFTQVSQLLSSNDIEYKAYSNETGHCIIIEL